MDLNRIPTDEHFTVFMSVFILSRKAKGGKRGEGKKSGRTSAGYFNYLRILGGTLPASRVSAFNS